MRANAYSAIGDTDRAAEDLGLATTLDARDEDVLRNLLRHLNVAAFDVKVPGDVINSWRTALDGANARLLQQVSGSMAELIAGQNIARIPDWSALLTRPLGTLQRRVAEQLEAYVADSGRLLQADLMRWIFGYSSRLRTSGSMRPAQFSAGCSCSSLISQDPA